MHAHRGIGSSRPSRCAGEQVRLMNELTVLVEAGSDRGGSGTCLDHVKVLWEPRLIPLAPEAAEYIEERWAAYLAEAQAAGKSLFNGAVSRLIDARRDENGAVVLRLAPTDYKTFAVTRLRDRAWFEVHAPQAMAPALGNSVLMTRGQHALLGIRSPNVSVYSGRAHLIGGVLDVLGTEENPPTIEGVIAHLRLELQEEAAVTEEDLEPRGAPPAWPRLLGIAQDEWLGQPEAIWQWEVRTPLEDIRWRLEPGEHTGSLLLVRGQMTDEHWRQMTPVARHAWRTWSGEHRPTDF
jgi:hypothetical protein